MQIDIELVNVKELGAKLKNMHKQLPKALRRDAWNLTQIYAKNLRQEALKQADTGELAQKTRPVKLSDNTYGISIPLYGIYQDRMKPHVVTVGGKRRLEQWARRRLGQVPKYLFVRPSHWIRTGKAKSRNQIRSYLNRQTLVSKVIQGRGGASV